MREKLLTVTIMMAMTFFAKAQNLILNHSCDDTLVGGEIPHWDEITGTIWTQRCGAPSPEPGNGTCYFFPGAISVAELAQTIDVSNYALTIDNGTQIFYFHGYERSFGQTNPDEANIYIEFADSDTTLLSSIHFGPYSQTSIWQEIDSALQVPVLTRYVKIRLRSDRNTGSNNDGYYDELYLGVNPWVGISEVKWKPNFILSPNPSNGSFYFVLENTPNENTTLILQNILGQKLDEIKLINMKTKINLDVKNGIYFATISTGKANYTTKIIIQR